MPTSPLWPMTPDEAERVAVMSVALRAERELALGDELTLGTSGCVLSTADQTA